MIETQILFRPSEVSGLMTNAKGKSNLEKYEELETKIDIVLNEYNELQNKETKKAQGLLDRVIKYRNELKELEPVKHLPNLSEGVKTQLRAKMIEVKYKRFKAFLDNKYTTKGKDCEERAITLYSVLKNKVFENNKTRVRNDYFSGEIDLPWYNENKVMWKITDIKNSYNIHTFYDNLDEVKKGNYWQGVAYMHLHPTVTEYSIANVLVDNTVDAILLDMHRESYRWENGDTPNWREIQILKDHVYTQKSFDEFIEMRGCQPIDEKAVEVYNSFVELPIEDRLIEHTYQRDQSEIERLTSRLNECRLYLELTYNLKHVA